MTKAAEEKAPLIRRYDAKQAGEAQQGLGGEVVPRGRGFKNQANVALQDMV